MERALVVGSSGGIGSALASALEARGVRVSRLSRRIDGMDISDAGSVERAFARLQGPFDLVIVATGILSAEGGTPEKSLSAIAALDMSHLFTVNAVGPALILKEVPRFLPKSGRSVVAVLSARVGSIGDNQLGGWYSYRASKAAANQIVRTAAIEIGRKRKESIVVSLHPGTVATSFTEGYPAHRKVSPDRAASNLLGVLDSLTPEQSGQFFDWKGKEVPW